jgi:hypothetical protein
MERAKAVTSILWAATLETRQPSARQTNARVATNLFLDFM